MSDSGGVTLSNEEADTRFFYRLEKVPSNVKVLWDLDGDGDFDEPEEDVTEFVTDLEFSYGRNRYSQLLGQVAPGRISATINNSDDRFAIFNASSPLNTPPFNIKSHQLFRVQDAATATSGVDPLLIVSDSFTAQGSMVRDELGNTWLNASDCYSNDGAVKSTKFISRPWLDIDRTDFYAQIHIERQHQTSEVGLFYRAQSDKSGGVVSFSVSANKASVLHKQVDSGGGIAADYGSVGDIELIDGRFLGVHVHGSVIDVYIDGELLGSHSAVAAGPQAGVGLWMEGGRAIHKDRAISQIKVWDKPFESIDGVLYTGRVTANPFISGTGFKIVTLEGDGPLRSTPNAEIETLDSIGKPPGLGTPGLTTGQYVGNCLLKAGIAPLGPIASSIILGATSNRTVNCLEAIREAENVELGRVSETAEGYIKFENRYQSFKDGEFRGQWTDLDLGGLSPESIELTNRREEKRNSVSSSVSPTLPRINIVSSVGGQTDPGIQRQIYVPTTAWNNAVVGDLMLCVIVHSVATSGESWLEPTGWRDVRQDNGTGADGVGKFRVYGHVVTDEDIEFSPTVVLYDDTNSSGGSYYLRVYHIENFHGSLADGLHVSSIGFMDGYMTDAARRGVVTHPGVGPPWGGEPTLHIFAQLGVNTGISQGGYLETPTLELLPYQSHDPDFHQDNHATSFVKDISSVYSLHNSTRSPLEEFRFLHQHVHYQNLELVDIMVRGYQGPGNTSGQIIYRNDNLDSQKETGAVLTYELSGLNFKDQTDARDFNSIVLERYSVDNPTVKMTFTATKSANHRAKALQTRLGDKIYLDTTGKSGLHVKGTYAVESISHRFSMGNTMWSVEWGLAKV